MDITEQDIEAVFTQNEYAKDKVAARWSYLSEHMEDLARLMTGDFHNDTADTVLLGQCIETCWAQCVIFWTETHLQDAAKQIKEVKSESTT